MRKIAWLFVVGMVFILSVQQTAEVAVAQEDSDDLALTIYNQGTALVQDRRAFGLDEGVNTLDFTDVAASIDATSVSFTSLTDPAGTFVLEQNYVYDLVDSSALLARYLDQRIEIITDDGETFAGDLLSGRNNEIILRTEAGEVLVVGRGQIRDIRFPDLPGGLITRPTLRWLVQATDAGDQQVELTYLTGGISWTADYNILLGAEDSALDLNGWVTLNNGSGTAYDNAQVKLVAGDVNRLPEPELYLADATLALEEADFDDEARGVEQREFFEYQLYEINRRVTVGDNETKQVEFVTGTDVPANTYFVYDASSPYFYGYYSPIIDPGYGQTGITDIQSWLEFTTGEEDGLGADLPAGRVRVYQEDVDGAALLIGENRIDHTPEGEDIQIFLGNAFDLVGERTQTNFNQISNRVIEETYQITLRNRKDDETVEIRVPEKLYRWSNWEILSSSHDYEKIDSATIEFRPLVEPGAEVVVTYTARYSWPR